MKRISFLLIATLLLSMFSPSSFAADDAAADDFVVQNGVLVKYTGTDADVVIPANLGITQIGDYAFAYQNQLTSVIIPEGVTVIQERAFYRCEHLLLVSLPSTLTSIGDYAFCQCYLLSSINIPRSVTSVGTAAFAYDSLTSATVPETILSVGAHVFMSTNLEKPIVVNYGKTLCYVPVSYTSYAIPNTVTEIISAFEGCNLLKSVTIPTSVTYIGDSSFSGCSSLAAILIPPSVTDVGDYAFCGTAIREAIFINNGKILAFVPQWQIRFDIPDTVTKIAGGAFYQCSRLTFVAIPDSVTYIGEGAFKSCSSLLSIELPAGVTYIGGDAFCFCTNLDSVDIPAQVTKIGDGTFYRCDHLVSITISDSVQEIGWGAFYGCGSLKSVYIPFGVTQVAGETFSACISLTSITIPDSVCSIGSTAFSNCLQLQYLTIPSSITEISDSAFFNDYGLTFCGTAGGYAEQYAKLYGLHFQALQENNNAVPTSARVKIDGKDIRLEAYTINGYNYFKLRDLAMALNGTGKQFDVGWNSAAGAISLTSQTPYSPVGGELAQSGGARSGLVAHTTAKVYLDERQVGFVSYQINGNNYFKLRDLAFYFDFSVRWDDASNTILIDTTKEYLLE